MNLSNKQYDTAKNIVTIWVPAITTAISGLGVLWGFESALIVGTIGILATAAGAILKVSTNKYNKDDPAVKEGSETENSQYDYREDDK